MLGAFEVFLFYLNYTGCSLSYLVVTCWFFMFFSVQIKSFKFDNVFTVTLFFFKFRLGRPWLEAFHHQQSVDLGVWLLKMGCFLFETQSFFHHQFLFPKFLGNSYYEEDMKKMKGEEDVSVFFIFYFNGKIVTCQ